VHDFLYPSICGLSGASCGIFVAIGLKSSEFMEEQTADEQSASDACNGLRPKTAFSFFSCFIYKEELLFHRENPIWPQYAIKNLEESFLQQLYGMLQCLEDVKRREILTGVRFDVLLRSRLDLAYFAPFPNLAALDFGSRAAPKVLIMNKSVCCCGNEDWFGIGHRDVMEHYMQRFLYLQQMPQPRLQERVWAPESFLMNHMEIRNATLVEDSKFSICILRTARYRTGSKE
jgi:hypothetical protein